MHNNKLFNSFSISIFRYFPKRYAKQSINLVNSALKFDYMSIRIFPFTFIHKFKLSTLVEQRFLIVQFQEMVKRGSNGFMMVYKFYPILHKMRSKFFFSSIQYVHSFCCCLYGLGNKQSFYCKAQRL